MPRGTQLTLSDSGCLLCRHEPGRELAHVGHLRNPWRCAPCVSRTGPLRGLLLRLHVVEVSC